MVASKPGIAATCLLVLLSLGLVARAAADDPVVRIVSADQRTAGAALLHQSDLGSGWRGGETKPGPLNGPECPGFRPRQSDLTVTGHANARFSFQKGLPLVNEDVQVMADVASVRRDFARVVSPKLGECIAFQLRKQPQFERVEVTRIPFPQVGHVSAAFRATIDVQGAKGGAKLITDYVFLGNGRLEYAFVVSVPSVMADHLVPFEVDLAVIAMRRAGAER